MDWSHAPVVYLLDIMQGDSKADYMYESKFHVFLLSLFLALYPALKVFLP